MRYGIPYKGSKNSIAEWVYSHFPKRNNFYDLFAGGCAILQVALMRQEYKNYIANDIDDDGIKLFMQGRMFLLSLMELWGVINTDNNEIETLLNEYVKNKNISKKSVDKNTERC